MEFLPKDNILKFNPDTLEAVRKLHGLDKPGAMDEAIDILHEWVEKQNHFTVKDIKREYLERIIIGSKGSVERSKSRLDRICTLRTMMPQFFEDYDIRKYFKDVHRKMMFSLLPNLTSEHHRVFWIKLVGQFETKELLHSYKLFILIAEYIKMHDYANGIHIVIDYREINLADIIPKINLTDLHQALTVVVEGYGLRLVGIHLLTMSKMINTIVMLFKQVLSKKLGERIYIHKNLETLYSFVPKELLPVECGGTERSIEELCEEWFDVISSKDFKEYRREMNRARTDESLRQTDTFNEQYMGMPGTFRALSVD